jgi:hypothetical protein
VADGVLVDILFLGVVHAHEGLDCLDKALGVADDVSIGLPRVEIVAKPFEETCKVEDLAMRAAHGSKSVIV